jgi:hypothetical protein
MPGRLLFYELCGFDSLNPASMDQRSVDASPDASLYHPAAVTMMPSDRLMVQKHLAWRVSMLSQLRVRYLPLGMSYWCAEAGPIPVLLTWSTASGLRPETGTVRSGRS